MTAILIAGACKSAKEKREEKTVEIYIRLSEDKIGDKYLELKDPINNWVHASICTTIVDTGDIVKWILNPNSKISRISKIRGKKDDGKMFKKVPRKMLFSKKIRLKILDDTKRGEKAEYYIEYKISDDPNKYNIDPMLRVPTRQD